MMSKRKSSPLAVLSITLTGFLMAAGLSGCTNSWYPFLYRPPVSQGNVINENALVQLKTGMSKAEVINLMGNPVLDTPLSPDTWHYIYTVHQGSKLVQHKQVILYFNDDKLIRVDTGK
jgi:outer membrane protein assembly factor BamE